MRAIARSLPANSNTLTGTVLLNPGLAWTTPTAIFLRYPAERDAAGCNRQLSPGPSPTHRRPPQSLPPGTHTLSVTFVPSSSSYGQASTTVQIVVNQDPTVITWPTPTPITYGTPLSGFQLDATASAGSICAPFYFFNVYGIYTPGYALQPYLLR